MRLIVITLFIILTSCSSSKDNYRKYNIEKGIITYIIKSPLKDKFIEQKVYFTDYGSTEYIEFVNKEKFPTLPILKKDSLEYIFLTDSMTIKKERGFDFIYEKLIKKNKSKLSNKQLTITKESDTLIHNKKCELFKFRINNTGQKGKVALWQGIPIWINSEWEKGLSENAISVRLDFTSEIPIYKTKIMDYIETE
jgi:hypothetical protein